MVRTRSRRRLSFVLLVLGSLLVSAATARAQMFDDFVLPSGSITAPAGAPPWVIADFDDGHTALRDGSPFVAAKGSVVASEAKIRHEGKGKSMKVAYEITGAVAIVRAELKGLDASKRSKLTFFVFGAREGSPKELEIVLRGAGGEGRARVKGISPFFWGRQVLTFEQLGLKDAAKLSALEIVVPADAKPAKGAFYIDRIAFE